MYFYVNRVKSCCHLAKDSGVVVEMETELWRFEKAGEGSSEGRGSWSK